MASRPHPILITITALAVLASAAGCGGSDRPAADRTTAARDASTGVEDVAAAGAGDEAGTARDGAKAGSGAGGEEDGRSGKGRARDSSKAREREAGRDGERDGSSKPERARRRGGGRDRAPSRRRPSGANAAAIAEGDRACADYRQAVSALPEDEATFKRPETRARRLAELTATLVGRLRSLRAGGDGARALASYVELLGGQPGLLRQLGDAAEREDEDAVRSLNRQITERGAEARPHAQRFGFQVCGKAA